MKQDKEIDKGRWNGPGKQQYSHGEDFEMLRIWYCVRENDHAFEIYSIAQKQLDHLQFKQLCIDAVNDKNFKHKSDAFIHHFVKMNLV